MRKLVLVLLLAAAAAYAYWPYHTADKFEKAVRAADKAELERLVDFPPVRESVKAQIKAKLTAQAAPPPSGQSATVSVGMRATQLLADGLVDTMVDAMITPEKITALLKLEAAAKPDSVFTLDAKRWVSPVEFVARTADQSKLRFRLRDTSGWRVTAIDLSDDLAAKATR